MFFDEIFEIYARGIARIAAVGYGNSPQRDSEDAAHDQESAEYVFSPRRREGTGIHGAGRGDPTRPDRWPYRGGIAPPEDSGGIRVRARGARASVCGRDDVAAVD